ncbi:hypothetical protein J8273_6710 [Carpediemonas membranifera]|uniref:Uncharacterized protein n=1 Tax=Carpediemonas membranifera TaxID=201153 RepID=A0A8J6AQX3_9EUKA|nr:hypothetical protein J8273_6710 [Carpediemonas membranifera]|eukprot:KAG9391981.1 hypothetical protein J8273_6710 [Carpediemonas membranifera]
MQNQFQCSGDCASCSSNACSSKPQAVLAGGCSGGCGSKPAAPEHHCTGNCSNCDGIHCGTAAEIPESAMSCGQKRAAGKCNGDCASCASNVGNGKAFMAGSRKANNKANVCPTCNQVYPPLEKRRFPADLETGNDADIQSSSHLACWPADLMHADPDSPVFVGETLYIVSVSALAAMGSVAAIAKGSPMLLAAVYPDTEEALREKLAEVFEKNEVAKAVVVRTNLKFDTGIVNLPIDYPILYS